MLTEVAHTKNHSAVMSWVKNSKPTRMTWYHIVRIRIDINIAFWNFYAIIVEFFYGCIKELKVHNPRIQNGCMVFRNHQMRTSSKFFIKTYDSISRNPFFTTAIIDCITCNISKFHFVNAFIANNATSFCIATCSFTVICNKYLCISWQTLLAWFIYRHIEDDNTRFFSGQLVRLCHRCNRRYIVSIKCSFNSTAHLRK